MFCPHCGYLNTDAVEKCVECGKPLYKKREPSRTPGKDKRQRDVGFTPKKRSTAPGKPKQKQATPFAPRKTRKAEEEESTQGFQIKKASMPPGEKPSEEIKVRKPWEAPEGFKAPEKEEKKEEEEATGFVIGKSEKKKGADLSTEFYRDVAIRIGIFILVCLFAFYVIKPWYDNMKNKEAAFQRELQRAIEGHETKNPDVLLALGKYYVEHAKYEKARQAFKKALLYRQKFPEVFYESAKLYEREKQYFPAIKSVSRAIKLDANNPLYLKRRGNLYMKTENPEKAIADFTKYIEIKSDKGEGYLLRGKAYLKADKFDEAIADFKVALKDEDVGGEAKRFLAHAYFKRGKAEMAEGYKEKAHEDFLKAYKTDPEHREAQKQLASDAYNKAQQLAKADKIKEAIELLDKATKYQPDLAKAHFLKANFLAKNKQNHKAVQSYFKAYEMEPINEVYKSTLIEFGLKTAMEQEKQGLKKKAFSNYNIVLKADPDKEQAILHRGLTAAATGHYETATRDLERIINLDPQVGKKYIKTLLTSYYKLGQQKFKEGSYSDAIKAYTGYLRRKPNEAGVLAARALAYQRGLEESRADADIQKAEAMDANDPQVQIIKARIMMDRRKLENAEEILTNVIKKNPSLVEAYYYRAKVYNRLNKSDEKRSDWIRVKELSKEGSDIWKEAKIALGEKILDEKEKEKKKKDADE